MKYGLVRVNLLDMWSQPNYNSERANQLFFGEPIKIIKEYNDFYFISQNDNYNGWVDKRFISLITKTAFLDYIKKTNSVVISTTAKIYDSKKKTITAPYFLYYGTKLYTKNYSDGWSKVFLPDGNRFIIKLNNIAPINKKNIDKLTGKKLIGEAKRFLGVPYLWGGITTAGFDCSGFVKTILSRFGIDIPRDTKEQIQVGKKVDKNNILPGDLLFFKRHVGFSMGKGKIIHTSRGSSGVHINSLRPNDFDYRKDLDRDFNQARRIL